jgi:hypothetical protein
MNSRWYSSRPDTGRFDIVLSVSLCFSVDCDKRCAQHAALFTRSKERLNSPYLIGEADPLRRFQGVEKSGSHRAAAAERPQLF